MNPLLTKIIPMIPAILKKKRSWLTLVILLAAGYFFTGNLSTGIDWMWKEPRDLLVDPHGHVRRQDGAVRVVPVGEELAHLGIVLVAMLAATRIERLIGSAGASVVSRIMGLILAAIAADGQITAGETVVKSGAKKIRVLGKKRVLAGFAGGAADALQLFERFESCLDSHRGNLKRAAVEVARVG